MGFSAEGSALSTRGSISSTEIMGYLAAPNAENERQQGMETGMDTKRKSKRKEKKGKKKKKLQGVAQCLRHPLYDGLKG